jgi:hypothetical protein
MKQAGDPDPVYIAARHVLLDSLEAVHQHLGSLILVGAQAVYLQTGEAGIAVAPYTTDGDLMIDPRQLAQEPRIEEAMQNAGFSPEDDAVGIWQRSIEVEGVERSINVDLLVPESLGGKGRRAARIPPHGHRTARKVSGLEGALVDRDIFTVAALDPGDTRSFQLFVAGPAALLVAKVHKILDRLENPNRRNNKDALDIYRLLRGTTTEELAVRYRTLLSNSLSSEAAKTAVNQIPLLFGRVQAQGTRMAVAAAVPFENEDTLTASLVVLTQDLLEALSN